MFVFRSAAKKLLLEEAGDTALTSPLANAEGSSLQVTQPVGGKAGTSAAVKVGEEPAAAARKEDARTAEKAAHRGHKASDAAAAARPAASPPMEPHATTHAAPVPERRGIQRLWGHKKATDAAAQRPVADV
jgi:hypothetical protein